jgi:hypothetical protein
MISKLLEVIKFTEKAEEEAGYLKKVIEVKKYELQCAMDADDEANLKEAREAYITAFVKATDYGIEAHKEAKKLLKEAEADRDAHKSKLQEAVNEGASELKGDQPNAE